MNFGKFVKINRIFLPPPLTGLLKDPLKLSVKRTAILNKILCSSLVIEKTSVPLPNARAIFRQPLQVAGSLPEARRSGLWNDCDCIDDTRSNKRKERDNLR